MNTLLLICQEIPWANILLIIGFAWLFFTLAKWQLSSEPFDIRDLIIDQSTRKVSLYNLTTLVFAILSIWVVVKRANSGENVTDMLLGVLGIFIVGRQVSKVVDARAERPPGEQ